MNILNPFSSAPENSNPSTLDSTQFNAGQANLLAKSRAFKQKMPEMQQKQTELASEGLRRGLQDRIKTGDSSLSSRGLLNSGLREGNVANAYNEYKSGVGQANLDANTQLRSQLQGMQQGIIQQGSAYQKQANDYNQNAYQAALQNRQANSNMFGNQGRFAGGIMSKL